MPINFAPNYTISSKVVNYLLRIETAKQKILHLPLTPMVKEYFRYTFIAH